MKNLLKVVESHPHLIYFDHMAYLSFAFSLSPLFPVYAFLYCKAKLKMHQSSS